MILHSTIAEFKKINPKVKTSNFESVFKLDSGTANAFVVLTRDGKYPLVFNQDKYPEELLQKEIVGIIERYYTFDETTEDIENGIGAYSVMRQEASNKKLLFQNTIIGVCNFLIVAFLILMGIFILFSMYGAANG